MDDDVRPSRSGAWLGTWWIGPASAVVVKATRQLGLSPRLGRESAWTVALRILYTGLSFLSTVLLARMLGAEGYGIYAYASALVWTLALPAQAGFPNLILRETARGMAQGRPEWVSGAWRWAGQMVGILTVALLFLAGPLLLKWRWGLSDVQGMTLAWALALVPLVALGNLRGAALRGLQRVIAGQLPEFVIRPALFVLLLVAAGQVVGKQLNAPQAMALQVSAALLAFMAGAWMLWRRTPLSVRQAQPVIEWRAWLASSLIFALISGFQFAVNQASTLILGLFESPEQVGVYRVAVQIATLASFGLQAMNMVVAPRFAELYSRGNQAKLQRLVTATARVVLASNIVLTALFVVLGEPFLQLVFGAEFAAAYLPLLILLVGQMVNSATGSVGFLLNMTGHERRTARGMAIAAIISIGLNLLLVPIWGMVGASLASAAAMIGWNLLLWRAVRDRLGINSLAFDFRRAKELP